MSKPKESGQAGAALGKRALAFTGLVRNGFARLELSDAVLVSPEDVRVVLSWMGDDIPETDIPKAVAAAVHIYLDGTDCQRTVPELYIPGIGPDWREEG